MLERLLVVGLLFAFSGAHAVLLLGPRPAGLSEQPDYDSMLRLVWIPLYVPLACLILRHWREIRALACRSPGLTLLILACPASALWSIAPEDTVRRSLALLMTAGFGWYLAARFDPRALLVLLAWALTIATATGLIAGVLFPDVGIMQIEHPGAWRGLFAHKGTFGRVATLNFVVVVLLMMLHVRHRLWLAGALIAAMVALALSRSLGAMIAAAASLTTVLFVAILRARNPISILGTLVLGCLFVISIAVVAILLDETLALLNRDTTLTGRIWVWQEIWSLIGEKPYLGYGYGIFQEITQTSYAHIERNIGWTPGHGHNGYLDIWLQIGVLGIVLFLWSIASAFFKLIPSLISGNSSEIYFVSALISFIMIQNMTESQLFRQNDLMTILYVTTMGMAVRLRRAVTDE